MAGARRERVFKLKRMRQVSGKIGCILMVFLLASCSNSFNKLRKSSDGEKKYQRALEYFNKGKYNKASILFQDIAPIYGGSTKGDTIMYYYGASLYKLGDFEGSGEMFDDFRRYFPRSPFLEDAEYMYAKGIYFTSPLPERDQTNTARAIAAIHEYLNRYPNSSKKTVLEGNLQELQQKLYDKSMISSRLYYDIGYYNSAITSLKNAIDLYPDSNHRELLSYLIVRSHYMYARNSVSEKQRQRYLSMQDAYYSFMAEYPESRYSKEVEKMQADAKKYLARYAERHPGAAPAADTTMMSDREQRKMQRADDKLLKQEDKNLTAEEDKIKAQEEKELRRQRKEDKKR